MYMKFNHIKQHSTLLGLHTPVGVSRKAWNGHNRDSIVQGFETFLSKIGW